MITNRTSTTPRFHERGSALVAVFWLIAVLGLIIFASLRYVSTDSTIVASTKNEEKARRFAEMGMAIGTHPGITTTDSNLIFENESGGGYKVLKQTEESRIAINSILATGKQDSLRRLFTIWGANEDLALAAADSLADWVDKDDSPGFDGAESSWYEDRGQTGLPRNRPFRSFEEILLVRGMTEIASLNPNWRDSFTIWGGLRLDINYAEPELIAAIAGLPLERAVTLTNVRAGYDGIPETEDDVLFSDVAQPAQILGIPAQLAETILTHKGQTERVESTGYAANRQSRLVTISRGGNVLWSGTESLTSIHENPATY